MNNKVKIISLSGVPVSGKSTVINGIKSRLIENGELEENIHIITAGQMFREYFNKIMQIVKNIDNEEKLRELATDKDINRIFSAKEYRHRIENAIAELKVKGFDPDKFDIESANNDQCLHIFREIIDDIIDGDIKLLGKDILKRNNSNETWLIDSRLAFMHIPESFAVRFIVDSNIAAKRLLKDKDTRGNEDNKYNTLEEAEEKVKKRTKGEIERFKEKYGVDLSDEDNYDLIIDTSYSDVKDAVDTVLICEELYRNGKNFTKNWTSPKKLLPTQTERDTIAKGSYVTLDEMLSILKNKGYDPEEAICVSEYQNNKYILDGHHRNFASAVLKKTLVPFFVYESDKSDDEKIRKKAIDQGEHLQKKYLYGHEAFFDDGDNIFSYRELYPEVFKNIEKNSEGR